MTLNGLAVAESRSEENFEYPELTREKVATQNFFHDLFVQTLTIVGINSGFVRRFATPRMSGLSGKEGEKIPDAIWFDKDDRAIAIEAERNTKYTENLDNFFGRMIESIEAGNMYECLIVMSSPAGVNNYITALKRKEIPMWTRKAGNPWRFSHNVTVRDEVRKRITILHSSELEMSKIIRDVAPKGDVKMWFEDRAIIASGNAPEGLD